MPMTVCPGCKDRPVAVGRYMCVECEDRMAGRPPRPPRSGQGASSSGQGASSGATPRCVKCGTPLNPEDAFCASCGAGQHPSQRGSSQTRGPAPTATASVKGRALVMTGVSLAVVLALTALVALMMFIWTQHQAIVAQGLADQAKRQRALAQQKAQEEKTRWTKDIAAIYQPPTSQQLHQSQPAAGDVFQTDTTVDPDSDPTATMQKQYQNSKWSVPGSTPTAPPTSPGQSPGAVAAPSDIDPTTNQPYKSMQTPKLFFPNDSVSHELGK